MKTVALLVLSATILVSCQKEPADMTTPSSVDQGVEKAWQSRPFSAQLQSSVDVDPTIPPTPCSGDLPGFANPGYFLSGKASHMGQLVATQSRGQDVTCDLSFTTMLLTTSVSGQLTAANGDIIFYTGNDVIDASQFLTGAGTAGTITGVWTITGGTGRFTGASGSFNIQGPADFSTGTFSFTASGTINY